MRNMQGPMYLTRGCRVSDGIGVNNDASYVSRRVRRDGGGVDVRYWGYCTQQGRIQAEKGKRRANPAGAYEIASASRGRRKGGSQAIGYPAGGGASKLLSFPALEITGLIAYGAPLRAA